jgi:putative spermidine/putrescine transport system permease protein
MKALPYSRAVAALAFLAAAFLVLPVLVIVLYAFNPTPVLVLPPPGLTLKWFGNFLANERFRAAVAASLGIVAIVTPASLVIGLPTALALVRTRLPGRGLFGAFVMSPLIIPGVVTGIAFLSFFARLGAPGSFWRLVIAMTCFTLPFAVRALVANLHGLDPRLEEAGRNLGGSPWRVFLHVTLPQLRPGLLAGGIFVFVEAIDNFSIAVFLTDLRVSTLPVQAYDYIRDFDDPTVAAMATMLIALSILLVFAMQRAVGLDRFFTMH